MSGGPVAIRGYLVQTLVALLDALGDQTWVGITLEPKHKSEKIDLLWEYPGRTKAVQVKSSENQISVADAKRWAEEFRVAHADADELELVLVGPCSEGVVKLRSVGAVLVPSPKNLDLSGFLEQAAHRLDHFLESEGLPRGNARYREGLANALASKLETLAAGGRPLTRRGLAQQLKDWTSSVSSLITVKGRTPVVFISSTSEDLKAHRTRAKDAAIRAGFMPRMMEYFAASGARPPLEACLEKIAGSETEPPADVLVVIVAYRYGWIPSDQRGSERKSITWLECASAKEDKKEVLAFLVDEKYDWPLEHREDYRINEALLKGEATPELLLEIQNNIARLRQFKAWLDSQGIRATFTTPESLHGEVMAALYEWREQHPEFRPRAAERAEPTGDPTAYLEALRDQTSHIDIRGLIVGSGKATRISIDELYIPLKTTTAARDEQQSGKERLTEVGGSASSRVGLQAALAHRVLLIVGDPGSGKTTFLRRIAYLLCQSLLGNQPEAAVSQIGLSDNPLPLLIRLPDLVQHIAESRMRRVGPTSPESLSWLAHYLAAQSQDLRTGLSEAYFQRHLDGDRHLERDSAIVLLDGLDEVPSHDERVQMTNLFETAAREYKKCRFVLTSRPAAFRDDLIMPQCARVQIDDLEDDAIQMFLERWCQAFFTESPRDAKAHCRELTEALRARPEIRRMARNPVMLTALAVVHWNEKRLPEQRADLYESILMWLARARKQRPGRPSPDRCINIHQELALAMQDHREGRQVQIARFDAAHAIAPQWRDAPEGDRIAAAEAFLREEELDSGIVVGRGNQVQFWHLTFQEYLAARALAGRKEEEQRARLLVQSTLYHPDWRETVLLLGGVLHRLGTCRVDAMMSSILDGLEKNAELPSQARCYGLLGAAVRDLAPVGYQPCDQRYPRLQQAVLGIFLKERSRAVDIRVAIEAAEALGRAGDPRLDYPDQNSVDIPAGEFWMGAQKEDRSGPYYDPEADYYEGPPHKVHVDAYRIGCYPVTVAEYQRFVVEEGYQEQQHWRSGGFGEYEQPGDWQAQVEYPNRPVVGVSWYEAAAYAAWAGCRLPTEAEWERAAKGTDGRRYPWGSDKPNATLLNYAPGWATPNVGHATPVGVYPGGATPEGVRDMGGNVWEWCQDSSVPYSERAPSDLRRSAGSGEEECRVARGGAWDAGELACRCSFRYRFLPSIRLGSVGFRVVLCAARTF